MVADKIRVMLVDDHSMIRAGLRTLLENFDDLDVVAEASDGEHALMHCQQHCPDVILMDVKMPRMNGIEATRRIQQHCPDASIIALTSFSDDTQVQDALQAGAISYLMKDVSGDELVNAIRQAHDGQATLAPEATQALIHATTRPPKIGHDLTEREREVLTLMTGGLSNREIAQELVISPSTVKNHVSSILAKLETTSRTQAVALAVEHQIVKISS